MLSVLGYLMFVERILDRKYDHALMSNRHGNWDHESHGGGTLQILGCTLC